MRASHLDTAREGVRPDHNFLLAGVELVVGHVVVRVLGGGKCPPHRILELHHARLSGSDANRGREELGVGRQTGASAGVGWLCFAPQLRRLKVASC